jgi:hypothetical protein
LTAAGVSTRDWATTQSLLELRGPTEFGFKESLSSRGND